MGSISAPGRQNPDSVHFANWKRLNDVSWRLPFENGRNFNSPPYSIGDSAVCYYYEPRTLAAGEKFTVQILLATGDGGFEQIYEAVIRSAAAAEPEPDPANPAANPAAAIPEVSTNVPNTPAMPSASSGSAVSSFQMEWDLALLHELLYQIDEYIISGTVTEADLIAIEQTLEQFRVRYGFDPGALR
jgi:hypothetical protein